MGRQKSTCRTAWGDLGFAAGYTTIALSSEDGERQVMVAANGLVMTDDAWDAIGHVVWDAYCA